MEKREIKIINLTGPIASAEEKKVPTMASSIKEENNQGEIQMNECDELSIHSIASEIKFLKRMPAHKIFEALSDYRNFLNCISGNIDLAEGAL
jgi:CheY-like chemotaxis protein